MAACTDLWNNKTLYEHLLGKILSIFTVFIVWDVFKGILSIAALDFFFRYGYLLHFTEEETWHQKDNMTYPRSHSHWNWIRGFLSPRPVLCQFHTFFFFWLCWVFVAVHRLPLVVASGGYSLLQCAGFSLRWLLLLQSTGSRRVGFSSCGARALGVRASVVVARRLSCCSLRALECRLSSCGARA